MNVHLLPLWADEKDGVDLVVSNIYDLFAQADARWGRNTTLISRGPDGKGANFLNRFGGDSSFPANETIYVAPGQGPPPVTATAAAGGTSRRRRRRITPRRQKTPTPKGRRSR